MALVDVKIGTGDLSYSGQVDVTMPYLRQLHGMESFEQEDLYDGSLSTYAMERDFQDFHYSDVRLGKLELPYTIEALFRPIGNLPCHDFDAFQCVYRSQYDTYVTPANHPLKGEKLFSALTLAYSTRRWDGLHSWGKDGTAPNRQLLKVAQCIPEDNTLYYGRTDYNTQATTNLVLDLQIGDTTLRKEVSNSRRLPELSSPHLANNLGIAILLIDDEGRPIFPLRSRRVSVFPEQWGTTVSFAADFPEGERSYLEKGVPFKELIGTAIYRQVEKETSIRSLDLLNFQPLALVREWFRGGKPQLFMFAQTTFRPDELATRQGRSKDAEEFMPSTPLSVGNVPITMASTLWDGLAEQEAGHHHFRPMSIEAMTCFLLYRMSIE